MSSGLLLLLGGAPDRAWAQGCIAIRNSPNSPLIPGDFTNTMVTAEKWVGAVGYRYYQSDRPFIGDMEDSVSDNDKVINKVNTFDVTVTYGITERWSATVDFPFIHAERSSRQNLFSQLRNTEHSTGLGDIRLLTDFWLFDPHQHIDGNIALGAGVKFPTGNDSVTDLFLRPSFFGGPRYRPVDASIQPGDGGWGIILELQAYQRIYKNLFAYVNGSYMLTPQEQNQTEVSWADDPTQSFRVFPTTRFNSIADQYVGRSGFSYLLWPSQGLTLSFGARIEGIPAFDAIGGSMGWRRPGYTISVEPGVSWTHKTISLFVLAPVAMYRNRITSAPESALGLAPDDAFLADYSILAVFTHRF